jgi:hypothetical protein
MDIRLSDIGHIIQLSIAPVFLLTGVGTNLLVLTNRLARIIDRSRYLEEKLEMHDISADGEKKIRLEAGVLFRRARKINRAIALSTLCALFICIVVASLFLDDAFNLKINTMIAMLFVSAMVSLTGSFIYLLREILMATEFLNKQNWHLHKS